MWEVLAWIAAGCGACALAVLFYYAVIVTGGVLTVAFLILCFLGAPFAIIYLVLN